MSGFKITCNRCGEEGQVGHAKDGSGEMFLAIRCEVCSYTILRKLNETDWYETKQESVQ